MATQSALNPAPGPVEAKPAKKKLVRLLAPDRSQAIRRSIQAAFVALNAYLGIEFFRWVRFYESAGTTPYVARPAGVEGYLPIAGLMNLKAWLLTGKVPAIHPAGMFLIACFLTMSWLFRKAFCSWLCPVGTLSEALWKLGRWAFRGNLRLPRWVDIPLRGLKYLLLGFFVFAVASMSAADIASFLQSPYGLIADVKMLNFFRYLSETAVIVLVVLAGLSIAIQNFWCRYLCPYGALLGLASLLSPLRILRSPEPCIDCGKCAKACPSSLKVDELIQIRSAECTACLECVAVCPAEGALYLAAPRRRRVSPWAVAAGIAVLFLGTVGYAKATGRWDTILSRHVYMQLVPHADEASHPMPGE
jgi:polyferredoxin